jgi:hypothetical protein
MHSVPCWPPASHMWALAAQRAVMGMASTGESSHPQGNEQYASRSNRESSTEQRDSVAAGVGMRGPQHCTTEKLSQNKCLRNEIICCPLADAYSADSPTTTVMRSPGAATDACAGDVCLVVDKYCTRMLWLLQSSTMQSPDAGERHFSTNGPIQWMYVAANRCNCTAIFVAEPRTSHLQMGRRSIGTRN